MLGTLRWLQPRSMHLPSQVGRCRKKADFFPYIGGLERGVNAHRSIEPRFFSESSESHYIHDAGALSQTNSPFEFGVHAADSYTSFEPLYRISENSKRNFISIYI
jgi:hypothetical protein